MKEINYENTYIYKIVSKDLSLEKCYVGSTTNFVKRKYLHKFVCNNENHKNHKLPLYVYINSNGGWDNFDMILIEKCCLENSLQCRMKEREYYELLNAQLNMRKPYLNEIEKGEYYKNYITKYNQDNKDYFKEYYQNNKEKYNKKKDLDNVDNHHNILSA